MTYNAMFPSKNPVDVKSYEFEFGDQLLFGEIITSAAVAASVYSGDDDTPSAIISGDAVIDGTKITQEIIGGVDGTTYNLVATVNASGIHVYTKAAYLSIVNPVTAY